MKSYGCILSILVVIIALGIITCSTAQNSQQDFVDTHNSVRAEDGVGFVEWDDTVAAYAENYANQRLGDCQLIHSGGPYGENLYKSGDVNFSAIDAVNGWAAEKQNYDYASNTCSSVCGHYTQIVWADSVKIGCARSTCDNGEIFIICSYSPQGNMNGERPY